MSSSRRTSPQSNDSSESVYSAGDLAYFEERLRNELYEFVIQKLIEKERSGELTRAQLARRIHKRPDRISHLLAAPGNWTLGTVSNLLLGIADEELVPHSRPIALAERNFTLIDWLKDKTTARIIHLTPTASDGKDTTKPTSDNKGVARTLYLKAN